MEQGAREILGDKHLVGVEPVFAIEFVGCTPVFWRLGLADYEVSPSAKIVLA